MTVQVEEKPDVTYSDVGGCKEQIEKLREVVETPLLHVSLTSAPGPPLSRVSEREPISTAVFLGLSRGSVDW